MIDLGPQEAATTDDMNLTANTYVSHDNIFGFMTYRTITILLVSLITVLAGISTFKNYVQNDRLQATSTELVTSLHLARSEAVTRATPVTACASTDGTTCTRSTNWGNGWIIFTDSSGIAGELDADDELIRVVTGSANNLTLEGGSAKIRYLASGQLSN